MGKEETRCEMCEEIIHLDQACECNGMIYCEDCYEYHVQCNRSDYVYNGVSQGMFL